MNRDSFRFDYDPVQAMANCGKLMGMELTPHGRELRGGYYMNGEPHPYRKDKLKIYTKGGSVWVMEEGDRCISLTQWLIEFGGAADYREAVRMIKGESQALHWNGEFRKRTQREAKFVSPDVLYGAKAYDLSLSPLFRHMCELFPEQRVRAIWNAYNVTATSDGGTCFWYLNKDGKICHDKVCWYGEDGHRKKDMPMSRKFRVGDGYSEKVVFGAHFKKKPKGILESEKSALYASCYYGGVWLACGGMSNLQDPGDTPLYPDRDAEESWSHKGNCVDWYSDWPECGDHSDLADKIEWLVMNNRK